MSQGDVFDKLLVQVALSQYEDVNQAKLPVSVNKSKDIPLQVASAEEAEIVDDVR